MCGDIQVRDTNCVDPNICLRLWKKESPEEMRWLLIALYNQLFVFLLLIIILSILELDDNQLYVVTVPMFLFAEANVVTSFFLPKFIKKWKAFKNSSSSDKTEMSTAKEAYSNYRDSGKEYDDKTSKERVYIDTARVSGKDSSPTYDSEDKEYFNVKTETA